MNDAMEKAIEHAAPASAPTPTILHIKLVDSADPSRWEWINKPITIWVLTSILVGLFSFLFSNYNDCRTLMIKDEDLVLRRSVELTLRLHTLDQAWPQEASIEHAVAKLKRLSDPQKTYFSAEFQGRSAIQIGLDLRFILLKWWRIDDESLLNAEDKAYVDAITNVFNFIHKVERDLEDRMTLSPQEAETLKTKYSTAMKSTETIEERFKKPFFARRICVYRALPI